MNRPAIDTGFVREVRHELRGATSGNHADYQRAWGEANAQFNPSPAAVDAQLVKWCIETLRALEADGFTFGSEKTQYVALYEERKLEAKRPGGLTSDECDRLRAASRAVWASMTAPSVIANDPQGAA